MRIDFDIYPSLTTHGAKYREMRIRRWLNRSLIRIHIKKAFFFFCCVLCVARRRAVSSFDFFLLQSTAWCMSGFVLMGDDVWGARHLTPNRRLYTQRVNVPGGQYNGTRALEFYGIVAPSRHVIRPITLSVESIVTYLNYGRFLLTLQINKSGYSLQKKKTKKQCFSNTL